MREVPIRDVYQLPSVVHSNFNLTYIFSTISAEIGYLY